MIIFDSQAQNLEAIKYEQIQINASITNLNPPVDAQFALIVLESDIKNAPAIRFREDNIDPSSAEGVPLTNLGTYTILLENLKKFRATQAQNGTHLLNIVYYA